MTTPGLPGRRASYKTLIDRKGGLTTAGAYFYSKLQDEPPNTQYDPTQRAVRAPRGRGESITLRDGSNATVRTWDHLKGE